MPSEVLSSNDYVSPQTLVDLCVIQGWAAVWVPYEAGSGFPIGHVHVFYKAPWDGAMGSSRMIYADQRGVKQIEELRREIETPPLPSKRGLRGETWDGVKWVATLTPPKAVKGLRADFIIIDDEYI